MTAINIKELLKVWSQIKLVKKIKSEAPHKVSAVLTTTKDKRFFLIVRPMSWLQNKNNLKILRLLKNKINTPKLLAYHLKTTAVSQARLWLLYEYIKPDFGLSLKNISRVAQELVKFHQLDIPKTALDFKHYKQKDVLWELKDIDLNLNSQLKEKYSQALRYFVDHNNSPQGWCHFDLNHKNFLITKD